MSAFKSIRKRLGMTQAALAAELGCTQGNVSFYENGQTVPPDVAGRLIEVAKKRGHVITYDDVYASVADDTEEAAAESKPAPDKEHAKALDFARRNTEQARMLRRALVTRDGPSRDNGRR